MKGLKVNMNYVNCALSVVVLILVVICYFKKPTEGFYKSKEMTKTVYQDKWTNYSNSSCVPWGTDSGESTNIPPNTNLWRKYISTVQCKKACNNTDDCVGYIYRRSNPDAGGAVYGNGTPHSGAVYMLKSTIHSLSKPGWSGGCYTKPDTPTIQYHAPMKDSAELREAVKLWLSDESTAIIKYGHISRWDTSNVTDMSHMFRSRGTFDEDIGKWDTSNVTSMYMMFMFASKFNQDISLWDIEKVKDMRYMFYDAYKFNQDIRKWKMTKSMPITNMFQNSGYNYPQPGIISLPNNLDVVRWSSRDDGYISGG